MTSALFDAFINSSTPRPKPVSKLCMLTITDARQCVWLDRPSSTSGRMDQKLFALAVHEVLHVTGMHMIVLIGPCQTQQR